MRLKQWQIKNKLSNVELAKKIGCDPSFISHFYAGRREFSKQMCRKISKLTSGKFSIMELLFPHDRA